MTPIPIKPTFIGLSLLLRFSIQVLGTGVVGGR
jgi:hypothetical protein